jgi:RNA recognition motif-containing protein
LLEVFKDYDVSDATIPHRRFTTTRNMGFGYVDVRSEDEQKKILEKLPTVEIKGRTCKVHPALAKPAPPAAPAEAAAPESQ